MISNVATAYLTNICESHQFHNSSIGTFKQSKESERERERERELERERERELVGASQLSSTFFRCNPMCVLFSVITKRKKCNLKFTTYICTY